MATKSVLAIVLGAVLLAGPAARAQQPPSLGELALKEQERRKALKASGPGKVVTDQDLPRGPAPAPTPPAVSTDAEKREKADEPLKPEEPLKDEAWWKQRINQERETLRRNEMFAEALQTRINSLTIDFASRDDPYQRARISEDRAKAIFEMDRVKAEVELTRKAIADIEEEARRAGVPPGWLR